MGTPHGEVRPTPWGLIGRLLLIFSVPPTAFWICLAPLFPTEPTRGHSPGRRVPFDGAAWRAAGPEGRGEMAWDVSGRLVGKEWLEVLELLGPHDNVKLFGRGGSWLLTLAAVFFSPCWYYDLGEARGQEQGRAWLVVAFSKGKVAFVYGTSERPR